MASCAHLVVAYADFTDWVDWSELSDDGMIGKHDPRATPSMGTMSA